MNHLYMRCLVSVLLWVVLPLLLVHVHWVSLFRRCLPTRVPRRCPGRVSPLCYRCPKGLRAAVSVYFRRYPCPVLREALYRR